MIIWSVSVIVVFISEERFGISIVNLCGIFANKRIFTFKNNFQERSMVMNKTSVSENKRV